MQEFLSRAHLPFTVNKQFTLMLLQSHKKEEQIMIIVFGNIILKPNKKPEAPRFRLTHCIVD